jgi:hypothetical protein
MSRHGVRIARGVLGRRGRIRDASTVRTRIVRKYPASLVRPTIRTRIVLRGGQGAAGGVPPDTDATDTTDATDAPAAGVTAQDAPRGLGLALPSGVRVVLATALFAVAVSGFVAAGFGSWGVRGLERSWRRVDEVPSREPLPLRDDTVGVDDAQPDEVLTYEPVHFVMERAMLTGIRDRVERCELSESSRADSSPRCDNPPAP